jgi:hypothetical protein
MEECFICCVPDGKSYNDILMEQIANRKSFPYPLILLSDAYGCKCNTKAHNKCLIRINKCPTCRKFVSKPKLQVKTSLDYWLSPLFKILKSKPQLIGQIKIICSYLIVLMIILVICIDKQIIQIPSNSNSNLHFHISIGILLSIQLICGMVFVLGDYFKKYWLYDEKTGTIG